MAALLTTYDSGDRIWSGSKRTFTYTDETSIGKIIFTNMKNWPNNVSQINDEDGGTVTFNEAITWAIRVAQIFKKKGFQYPDVIGLPVRNSTYVMSVAVACYLNGTPFHAINPVMDEATMTHVFSITKPKIIFCDGQDYEKVQAASKEWQPDILTVTDPIKGVPHIQSLLDPTPTEAFYQPEPLKEGSQQTMAILCSSGTTGLPKAVCISNRSLQHDFPMLNSESVVFSFSGLDWSSGLITFLMGTVIGCTRIITQKAFSPDYFVRLVEKYKINSVILAPHHMSALINYPGASKEAMASLRCIIYIGGFTSMTTLKRVQELCSNAMLINAYGMTETSSITFNMGLEDVNSVGKPLPGVRIRIVDEDGKSLGYKEVGEIYVHNGRPWKGYFGNPEETRRMQDSEGWFHTGDLGYFDEQNRLFVVDRKKEMCKYQGYQYLPSEIEGVISELPQVEEVCVVSIYDEEQGDAAGALVVKRQGVSITEQEIKDHVARRLPAMQKQLHAGVQFTDKLPINSNGKIFRRKAQEEFLAKKKALE
ncbi:4-coumarate--CoA ligase 1-like isoform X1 [Drosophila serrata]|uniref:4-coumarate--CoA ligase 1-like isoform X1 n=1 Tax=Drosophila serrata TaxID=7274 RepID=UPI000A1D3680|nr:4-coumarate--CoA ligase 1-like isoform X1 [Drosophila serrata]